MADPDPVRSLADHQSLRERIVARLRAAIVAGDLPSKSRLMEPELARRLSVSRTPLRGKGPEAERLMRSHIEGVLAALRRRIRSRGDGQPAGAGTQGDPSGRRPA